MRFESYLFPVTFKNIERVMLEYEKALDNHVAQVQVSLLWLDHR